MTPIYDQLLEEFLDAEDSTFTTDRVWMEITTVLPHNAKRTSLELVVAITQKEESPWQSTYIPIKKTPFNDSRTVRSSGVGSVPVKASLRRRTTSGTKRRKTST